MAQAIYPLYCSKGKSRWGKCHVNERKPFICYHKVSDNIQNTHLYVKPSDKFARFLTYQRSHLPLWALNDDRHLLHISLQGGTRRQIKHNVHVLNCLSGSATPQVVNCAGNDAFCLYRHDSDVTPICKRYVLGSGLHTFRQHIYVIMALVKFGSDIYKMGCFGLFR